MLLRFLLVLKTCLFLSACLEVDSQIGLPEEYWRRANPSPVVENPLSTNSRHKVLVAVIDSGVDYNHPQLRANIHYTLDANTNRVLGAGWDFLGQDSWASPNLIRTLHLNPQAPQGLRQRSTLIRETLQKVLKIEPSLTALIDPDRLVEAESFFMSHGTQVAGLIANNNPEIGILPLRALPVDYSFVNGKSNSAVYVKSLQQIIAALEMALAQKARIINLSLSFNLANASKNEKSQLLELKDRLYMLIKNNPNTLFVVAAGNEGEAVKVNKDHFPCGMDLSHIICVTALNKEGTALWEKSNKVDAKLTQAAEIGEDVATIVSTGICVSDELSSWAFEPASVVLETDLIAMASNLKSECARTEIKSSGTSFAAPKISRFLAEKLIDNSNLTNLELIQKLNEHQAKQKR